MRERERVSPTVIRPRQSSMSSVGVPCGENFPLRNPVLGCKHRWIPPQALLTNEVILFAYAADFSMSPTYICLLQGLVRARNGRIVDRAGEGQEVLPLPGIYFLDAWRVEPCCNVPNDLPEAKEDRRRARVLPKGQRSQQTFTSKERKKPEIFLQEHSRSKVIIIRAREQL